MRLYIVRHGEAVNADDDQARILSEAGRERVRKTAAFLERNSVRVGIIYHSVKTRARETAALIAERIMPAGGIKEASGLKPNDPVNIWLDKIKKMDEDAMLVGHLPHLSVLISSLAAGSDKKEILVMGDASAVCLEKNSDNAWSLIWFVNPDII